MTTTNIDFETIRSFYKGAQLKKVDAVLPGFQKSIERGYWEPGISRSVRAAFYGYGKAGTVKMARAIEFLGNDFGHVEIGNIERVLSSCMPIDMARMEETLANVKAGKLFYEGTVDTSRIPHAVMSHLETALSMAKTLEPMWNAIAKLDIARPVPVFTMMNASPLVSAEMKRQQAVSVNVPEMKEEWVEMVGADGRKTLVPVMNIVWPEDIIHGTSRHADGQCGCCGHTIRNPFNWVPLYLTSEDGSKKSIWVGRDCAKTLFGVDMKGDLTVKS